MYVKLFTSILESTVWAMPDPVLRVWLTLLLISDSDGCVRISLPGLAKRAGVNLDECKEALARLEAPDPDSQSKAEEGRRLLRIGGDEPIWQIVNYTRYRGLRDRQSRREYMADYMRDYRKQQSNSKPPSKQPLAALAQAEVDAEVEVDAKKKKDGRFAPPSVQEVITYTAEKNYHFSPEGFVAFYQSKGWKVGKEPMKDWKAACITWENRWKAETPGATPLPKNATLCRDCQKPMTKADLNESAFVCHACRLDHGV